MNISVCRLPAALLLGAITGVANAGTTGSIGVEINLTRACTVNGSVGSSNVDFGKLIFKENGKDLSTLFTEATGWVMGGGNQGISIQCSPGADAVLKFNAGLHDGKAAGGSRALCGGDRGDQCLPYDIYDVNSIPLSSGQSINVTADGSEQIVPVYGRAKSVTGLYPGKYTDSISVELEL